MQRSGCTFLYVWFGLQQIERFIIILRSKAQLTTWVFLGYFSRSGVKQVSSGSILPGTPLCEMSCTRSFQLGGIVPSFMNGNVENYHQTPHEIEVIHDQFLGLEPGLLILHEMLSDQDIILQVIGVPTWVVQICYLAILHPLHKLDIPICGDFNSNICCCACKILHGSNTIHHHPP